MKIAIDISQIQYETGVSNYTKNLVKHLLKIDHHNHYLLYGTSLRQFSKLREFVDSLPPAKNLGIKLYRFPISLAAYILGKTRILPIDKFIGSVDLIHTSDWIEPRVRSDHIKKVTTVHDLAIFLFPTARDPGIFKIQKIRLDHVKTESALIFADSKTTKDDLIRFLDIHENKIKVINLAPSGDFKPQDDGKISEVLAKYKIKKPYILSVGTQEPRKNIQKLIDAYVTIRKNFPQVNLVLTGKYGWGEDLNARLEENTNGKITITGFVPQEDLPVLYAGARVFVYPSLYEGFGLPILEAMAAGTPVIASNNSSMAEIAKDAAILVDPRSENQLTKAIELVLGLNLENYQKMVRASMERAREYSWSKTAKETLKSYEEVFKTSDNRS